MKKTLKRTLAFLLMFTMVFSVTNVFAMITPKEETGIIKADDYEGEKKVNFGNIVTLENGNKVVQPKQAQHGWSETTIFAATAEPQDIVISFDAMAAQTTDAYQMFIRRTTNDTEKYRGYCDFAGIEFSDDGTIRRNNNGDGALNAVYGAKLADYNANQWYSIDLVIEGVASKTYNTTVKYYIDGVLVDTLDASPFANLVHPTSGLHFQSDAVITSIFVGSDDAVTDGKMYFDNVKIYKADADLEYYAYSTLADGKIDIEFSETPVGSMNGAVIKANNGTTVTTTVSQKGRKMTATYDKALLKGGEEYTLVLPANKSVTGKKLANNAVVFTAPRNELSKILYVAEHNFDNWTDAASGAASINGVIGGCTLIPSTVVTAGEGKALQIGYAGSGYGATHLLSFGNGTSSAYQWNKVAGLNEFITELDIKAPELKHVSPEFIVFGANDHHIGRFWIDKNGYFTASTNLNANNNVTVQWDGVVTADGTYKTGFSEATHKVVKTTPGEWYNVKVGINPSTGVVRYYFENELLAEYVNPRITASTTIVEFRIRANDWADDTVTSVTEIDNVKFGWALGDAKIENLTGITVSGKNAQPANGGWGVQNSRVELMQSAETESSEFANSAAIISADITLDTVANNLMPTIYSANGNVMASFWILNSDGDVYIQPEAQNYTGTDSDKDGKYTFETGTATVKGAFKPGVATNVTAYMDASRTYLYLFLNGMFVKKLETKWLQGVTAKVFDIDKDGVVESFEMIPARIGVRLFEGTDNAGNISVKNARLYSTDKATVVENIRLNSGDDEFSIYSANIPNQLDKIVINYSANITSAPAVALADAEGTAVTLGTATVSGKKVTIPVLDKVIANGTYTLTVGETAYVFVVNNDMSLVISDFSIVNSDGDVIDYIITGEYYATVSVLNTTAIDQNIALIIATYKNSILEDIDFFETTLTTGGELVIDETSADAVTLEATMDTTAVRAFLWSGFKNAVPYREQIEIVK